MSQQLEQVKALIQLREKARLGGGQKRIVKWCDVFRSFLIVLNQIKSKEE